LCGTDSGKTGSYMAFYTAGNVAALPRRGGLIIGRSQA
jgi:hypothetical protein